MAGQKVKAGSDSLHYHYYALDPSDKVIERCQYTSLLLWELSVASPLSGLSGCIAVRV